MQYVLLIHAAESQYATMAPEAVEKHMEAHGRFSHELFATGKAGDSAALELTHTATTVRVREGKRSVKDGPFAETREQLGGYYSVDVETEEEALGWAAKIPDAVMGTIEVRPIPKMPPPQAVSDAKTLDPKAHKEYILLIYEAESLRSTRSEADREAVFGRYIQLNKELRASGHFIAGEPLNPAATARCVSVDHGKRVVRDGPFAETREQLGGYYRVWARDLDEAISIAARIPAVETGTVEVRPVMDTSAYT